MPDYLNSKLYKIYCYDEPEICYIGATTKKYLSSRFADHKCKYKSWLQGEVVPYVRSFDIFEQFGVNNCVIELIEDYPCINRDELARREGQLIITTGCVNKNVAGRTREETNKAYYDYTKIKCDCGVIYAKCNTRLHKWSNKHNNWYRTTIRYKKYHMMDRAKRNMLRMDSMSRIIKLI